MKIKIKMIHNSSIFIQLIDSNALLFIEFKYHVKSKIAEIMTAVIFNVFPMVELLRDMNDDEVIDFQVLFEDSPEFKLWKLKNRVR